MKILSSIYLVIVLRLLDVSSTIILYYFLGGMEMNPAMDYLLEAGAVYYLAFQFLVIGVFIMLHDVYGNSIKLIWAGVNLVTGAVVLTNLLGILVSPGVL